jgi:hypothetical protein
VRTIATPVSFTDLYQTLVFRWYYLFLQGLAGFLGLFRDILFL